MRRSGITEGYIRHIVTRGVGDLGLDPRKCPRPSVIIIVDTIKLWPEEVYETGLKVVTAGTPIPQRESLSPRVKSLNYLAHILAKIEGIQAGADEVLMLDSAGSVAEGSGQNIFVVKHGSIVDAAGLRRDPQGRHPRRGHGARARAPATRCSETMLNRYDVYTADEAFFTGTAAEIVGIRQVDGRLIGAGKSGSGHPRPPGPLPGARPELTTLLSVVIPTLDEAPRLPRLLQDLSALTVPHEIIVADGGSVRRHRPSWRPPAAPRRPRAARARSPARAPAWRPARGDWLLVLHADARLTPAALARGRGGR